MPPPSSAPINNRLRVALPRKDREQWLSHCERVELVFAEVIYRAGLEAAACGRYRADIETCERILGTR